MHFFLHGGVTSTLTENNKKFFQDSCHDGDSILIIPFAAEEHQWQDRFNEFSQRYAYYNPEKKLTFVMASTDIPTLTQQLKDCNVLYVPGSPGTLNLIDLMNNINGLKDILEDKTIVGSSAGVNMRSTYYYSQRHEKLNTGLGILPIKTIVHRGVDRHLGLSNEERLRVLKGYKEDLPIYTFPEGEYREFEIEDGKFNV